MAIKIFFKYLLLSFPSLEELNLNSCVLLTEQSFICLLSRFIYIYLSGLSIHLLESLPSQQVYLSIYQVYLFIYLLEFHLPPQQVFLSIYQVYLSIYWIFISLLSKFIYLSIRLICLSIYLSIGVSSASSAGLSIYQVYLYIYLSGLSIYQSGLSVLSIYLMEFHLVDSLVKNL